MYLEQRDQRLEAERQQAATEAERQRAATEAECRLEAAEVRLFEAEERLIDAGMEQEGRRLQLMNMAHDEADSIGQDNLDLRALVLKAILQAVPPGDSSIRTPEWYQAKVMRELPPPGLPLHMSGMWCGVCVVWYLPSHLCAPNKKCFSCDRSTPCN